MDYRETLNLPKTDFPMKANLAKKELEILGRWYREDIYSKILESRKDCPLFILHDGPPYANGNIHIGHALNKILKDFVVKSKTMEGYRTPFVPGWDCHGLPIEHQVDKELEPKKKGLTKDAIRKICRKYAEKYIGIQREEFKRLGVFGDWDNPYVTMDYDYEAEIVRELGRCFEKGLVYRGAKPVFWCISCVTALAEAEVEYDEHESLSVYVKFKCKEGFEKIFHVLRGLNKPCHVIIWTTTPWTLPANLAIAVHPDYYYSLVDVGEELYILADGLVDECMAKFGVSGKVLAKVKGADLENLRCEHPFENRDSVIILADFVTLLQGTGCVHIAPGHGEEDYMVGLKYGLEVYNPVDDHGRFDNSVTYFKGENIWDANPKIVELLKDKGALILSEVVTHSYPHCWRCKNPVIFRATPQWFISMERNNLRGKCLEEIDRVKWIPDWGRIRIRDMVEKRPDWCISRQRAWGVPITVVYCNNCGYIYAGKELFDRVVELMRLEGADVWFTRPIEDFIPKGFKCPNCGGVEFRKETDILDVWFDSGVSHAVVLEKRSDLSWPADLYLEGSDQHRGWFQSSLIVSVATRDGAPYRSVLTHGFVVDGEGRKMSKSLGNVISPQEVIETYGADILRLWVAAEDYTEDVRLSKEILDRLVDSYRKIRNTIRFMLGNLYDFNPNKDLLRFDNMLEMDRWIVSRFSRLTDRILDAYRDYLFYRVFHLAHGFCNVDLSAIYLDIVKERLYVHGKESHFRKSAQSAIYVIAKNLIKLLAPILSFTMEEAWQYLPRFTGDFESVHLEYFPREGDIPFDSVIEEKWNRLLDVRKEVNRALEIARNNGLIRHSYDSKVVLFVSDDNLRGFIDSFDNWTLREFLIVSQVEVREGIGGIQAEELKGLSVEVLPASGKKCVRCWVYSESVGENSEYPEICNRCVRVLKGEL
ncbi:MAG: isoleucine--tRNA ligase [Thermosulfidibacteraceae bacterium]|jgi:isoleucyl-tRNA synthetase